jgi:phospholipid N-methyltransferase
MPHSETETRLPTRLSERIIRALGPWGMFLKGFIKHPVMVGSIIPSSDKLIDHMLSRVNWAEVELFVEYGPGVGTYCRPILDRMRGNATLIAIDTNADFIDYLRREIGDSRFIPVLGSATDVEAIVRAHGFTHADHVLSGLPFSTLPSGVGPAIAAATHRVLRQGGSFLVYQFRKRARDFLLPHFSAIEDGFEWWNIPPCFLFWATRTDASEPITPGLGQPAQN